MKSYDNRQVSIKVAEKHIGYRLDHRRIYAIIDGELCQNAEYTDSCSGCFEAGEYMGNAHNYGYDEKRQCYVGSGCEECGYTGKRRVKFWMLIKMANILEEA